MATHKEPTIHEEIDQALSSLAYGSIEIYVNDKIVTQITVRNIKKTSVSLNGRKKTIKKMLK